ncbi:MAG: asparaginase domain-containing protein [Bacillota bacterium]|nr:asparaginase domain-containing protein [Bacillota bacterium]
MKRILVVLTGGTIGSQIQNESMDVTNTSPYRLLEMYRKTYGTEDQFDVLQPFSVLSENMTPGLLGTLCRAMCEIDYEKYRGVILAHGSDTLAYTSALLGMLLGHAPVPVVLIAANYPLEDERSNGLPNFRSAVELIHNEITGGVYTIYQKRDGHMPVYLSTRLTEADAYCDQFGCFGKTPLGEMKKGRFVFEEGSINPSMEELGQADGLRKLAGCPEFNKQVLMLRPYPGLSYDYIDLEKRPAAVLHYLYHSATACTKEEEYSFLRFLERCHKREIPVYTASYKGTEGRLYVTAREIMEMGVTPMVNISAEAAYMKLMLLYNMELKDLKGWAARNIYFENLPG